MPIQEKNFSFTRRMFLAYARTLSLPHARELALQSCTAHETATCKKLFDHFERVRRWTVDELIHYVGNSKSPLGTIELTVIWFMNWQPDRPDRKLMEVLRRTLAGFHGQKVTDNFFALWDGLWAITNTDFARGLYLLGQTIGRLEAWDGEPTRDFYRARACLYATSVARRLGSPTLGRQLLVDARKLCRRWDFAIQAECASGTGQVLDAEGKHALALAAHRHAKTRANARRLGRTSWLHASHNAAAKNALLLGRLDIAEEELARANEIIRRRKPHRKWDEGYTILLGADVLWRKGDHAEALESVERAYHFFEELSPPYTAGMLHAVIARARFCAEEHNYSELSNALDQIEELLPEWLDMLTRRNLGRTLPFLRARENEESKRLQSRIEGLVTIHPRELTPQL